MGGPLSPNPPDLRGTRDRRRAPRAPRPSTRRARPGKAPRHDAPFRLHHHRDRRRRAHRHDRHAARHDPHPRLHAGRHRRDGQGREARRRSRERLRGPRDPRAALPRGARDGQGRSPPRGDRVRRRRAGRRRVHRDGARRRHDPSAAGSPDAPRTWREITRLFGDHRGAGSRPPTPPASSTATSSRTTCSSIARAAPRSPTSGSPSPRPRRPLDLAPATPIAEAMERSRTGALVGTPLYMSPEQLAGRAARRAQRSVQLRDRALRGALPAEAIRGARRSAR